MIHPNANGKHTRRHLQRGVLTLLAIGSLFTAHAEIKRVPGAPLPGAMLNTLDEGYVGFPVKKLPLILYDDANTTFSRPYVPSGWMGNHEVIDFDEGWKKRPHSGATCIRVRCGMSHSWFGIVWQSPANDWGDQEGGWDLINARQLSFWARGENGGEKVEFKFGILREDQPYPDTTGNKGLTVSLTRYWKQYVIPLTGNKRCIKTGFVWVVDGCDEGFTFYLDDIKFE